MPAIRAQFGTDYVLPSGAMDRKKMRDLVFSDATAKMQLESILHPLIRAETDKAAAHAHGSYLMFVVPLLVESGGWAQRVSRVLVVDCSEAVQIARVRQRNGLNESQVRAIIASQATRAARLAVADDVVLNDGDASELAAQIDRLHALYSDLVKHV
jgi:dephospho-CoA kinase